MILFTFCPANYSFNWDVTIFLSPLEQSSFFKEKYFQFHILRAVSVCLQVITMFNDQLSSMVTSISRKKYEVSREDELFRKLTS